jgi:Ni/Co efflux regulator RcnB
MKTKLFSLAALLLAGAAQGALAQDNGQDHDHGRGGPQAAPPTSPYSPERWRQAQPGPQGRPAPQPSQARPPQVQQPQVQQPQAAPRHAWHGGGPGVVQPQPQPPRPGGPPQGDRRFDDQGGPEGRHGGDHGPPHGGPGPGYGERPAPPPGGRPGYDQGHDWNRGHDNQGHDNQGHDNQGHDNQGHDWDRGRYDGPRWAPRAYPPVYNSPGRYRAWAWVPPPGYYHRAWRYGEYLPRPWLVPDYFIGEWWDFQLPEPPPGYEWVRVGYDALLVDAYSGQIVQVVRDVFW